MHITEGQKQHIRNLLLKGKKIEAIKFLQDNYKLRLKQSKRLVDLVEVEIRENEYTYHRAKILKTGKVDIKFVGKIFSGIGILMLIPAVFIFISNQNIN